MNLMLFLILLVNVLISVWNCYAVGSVWETVRREGGPFSRILIYSGLIQSGVGFSLPLLLLTLNIAIAIMTDGKEPLLTEAEGATLLQGAYSLWYVGIIVPVLGSGLAI